MNNKQKKQSAFRLLVQCCSFAFHNGYVNGWLRGKIYTGDNKKFCVPGLNCYSCPGALGACPIGSLQAVLDSGTYRVSLYVIGFIGALGMLSGRAICGWLCPFGLVQDLLHRIPFPKKRKNLPGHDRLRYLRFLILAVFVILLPALIKNQSGAGQPWFCEYICPSGTLLGGYPLVAANENLRALIGPRFIWKSVVLLAVIAASVISYRPFCKYVCPLGALYGLANPVSLYRMKVNSETCVSCGECQKACGMDIKVWEKPNSMDCIRCGKCMAACPTGSIVSSFAGLSRKRPETKPECTVPECTAPEYTVSDSAELSAEAQLPQTTAEIPETEVKIPEKKRAGGVKRFLAAVLGLICILLPLCILIVVCMLIYMYAVGGRITSVVVFGQTFAGYLMLLLPSLMTLLLGGRLLKLSASGDNPETCREWARKNAWLTFRSLIFTYIICLILVLFMSNGFSAGIFLYAGILMMVAAGGFALLILTNLFAVLMLHEKKR